MANTIAQSNMASLWDEVAQGTDMNASVSKMLPKYEFSDLDGQRSSGTDISAAQADTEWIPQEYRFTAQDGIVSTSGDFQDLTERMIPVRRNKAKRILFQIGTKALRDPRTRSKAAQGVMRDIRNAVDTTAYQEIINQSSLVIKSTSDFDWTDGSDAEILMVNNGLSAYQKKLLLSNSDYSKVAQSLGNNQYYGKEGVPLDAFSKSKIPDIATFMTHRSDYLLNLAANATTTATVNGNQSHTVATYTDANQDNYLDNRSMTLNVNVGLTTAVGTKFTIAGVNAYNPETRTDNGSLQTFTVIGGTSLAPIIQPAIVITGPYQNCSAQAADTAAITVLNNVASNPSVFWTEDSVQLVPGRLPVTGGGVDVVEAVTEQGLPMRMTYEYDFHNEVFNCKALIFFDVAVINPEQTGIILTNQT
jgi:hypothetical protein